MSHRFAAIVALCFLALCGASAASAQTTTALFFDSQPGDWIGGGVRRTWTDADLKFSAISYSTASDITIGAADLSSGGGTWWYLEFRSPGGTVLAPGLYEDAGDAPFASALRPALSVSGSGRGCPGVGRFIVYEIAFDSSGKLVRFAADFEQHCSDAVPALFGAVRFNSTRSNLVPFDGAYPVYALHIDPSPFGTVGGGGLDCGAGGVTCDLPFGAATTVVLTATPALGYMFLGWSGDCTGQLPPVSTLVSRRKHCAAVFDPIPGSGMPPSFGGGNMFYVQGEATSFERAVHEVMPSSETAFRVVRSTTSDIELEIVDYMGDSWWIEFAAPNGQALAPGVYDRASRAAFHAPLMPGFELSGPSTGCNTLRARFVIDEIAFDNTGGVTRLAADFEQHCDSEPLPATFGSLRYNATRTVVVPFDGAYPVYALTITPPTNGKVSGPGINCGPGAGSDCAEIYPTRGPVTIMATPAPGHVFVGWTGDCRGSALAQITIFTRQTCGAVFDDVAGATGSLADDLRLGSMTIFSQPGEFVGRGLRQVWTRQDTQIRPLGLYSSPPMNTVGFDTASPDMSEQWELTFAARPGDILVPRDYTGAVSIWSSRSVQPGLEVRTNGRVCATLTGWFRVYEASFDGSGRVTAFAADFEQHCNGSAAALFGAIRYNSTRSSVLPFDGAFLTKPLIWLDTPVDGSRITTGTVAIGGWALNTWETSGTGVDTVHVYAFPLAGGPPIWLGVADYGASRPDLGSIFGAQFKNSGFNLTATGLTPGQYLIAAYAHDTLTGTFDAARTATITIPPPPATQPRMAIDSPAPGTSLATALNIDGWAIDAGALAGSGIDAIHVYAFRDGSGTPIFLGVGQYGASRPDIAAIFGEQFSASGYHLHVSGLPSGSYTVVVYARSTLTGQFTGATRTVTLIPTAMAVDTPADGSHATGGFVVSGWAFDSDAPSGAGVDAVHVWAVPAGGGMPVFLGEATLNVARPDLGQIFGARFANAGFTLAAPALPPGTYTIAVSAHSAASRSFNQMRTLTVVID